MKKKFIIRAKNYISMIVTPAVVVLVGFVMGMKYGDVPHSGLEGLPYFIAWLSGAPIICMLCSFLNVISFSLVEYGTKRELRFLSQACLGFVWPVLINILFWANIKEFVNWPVFILQPFYLLYVIFLIALIMYGWTHNCSDSVHSPDKIATTNASRD